MATWITPKTHWAANDHYNFDDLNRVENNTEAVVELMSYFDTLPPLTTITNREMKRIEFADSLNRIERNQDLLKRYFTPLNWIENKLDWTANSPFNFEDAARLESNLTLLYLFYKGNASSFRRCGAYTCGEDVV